MARFTLSAFADEADAALSGQIAALTRNGITRVELRGVDGRPSVQFTIDEAKDVRRKLDDAGITVGALGSPFGKIGINDDFESHLDGFKHALELCHTVGTGKMRVFSFYIPKDENPADYRQKVMDQLERFHAAAHDAGITLALENEKGIYGEITERCLDLAQAFAGRIGCIFDPANFLQCGVNPLDAMDELIPYIAWMHIKDARLKDGQVTPAGKGDGGVPELIRRVNERYKDTEIMLTVEPHLALFSGYNQLENSGVRPEFMYKDNNEAFDVAAAAAKALIN